MSDREMVRLLFRSLAAAQKTAKMGIAGWRGQYLYKDDVPGEYYEKLVADLAGPTAVLTHSYASEGQAPEISMFTLVENPDATIYPFDCRLWLRLFYL